MSKIKLFIENLTNDEKNNETFIRIKISQYD